MYTYIHTCKCCASVFWTCPRVVYISSEMPLFSVWCHKWFRYCAYPRLPPQKHNSLFYIYPHLHATFKTHLEEYFIIYPMASTCIHIHQILCAICIVSMNIHRVDHQTENHSKRTHYIGCRRTNPICSSILLLSSRTILWVTTKSPCKRKRMVSREMMTGNEVYHIRGQDKFRKCQPYIVRWIAGARKRKLAHLRFNGKMSKV